MIPPVLVDAIQVVLTALAFSLYWGNTTSGTVLGTVALGAAIALNSGLESKERARAIESMLYSATITLQVAGMLYGVRMYTTLAFIPAGVASLANMKPLINPVLDFLKAILNTIARIVGK